MTDSFEGVALATPPSLGHAQTMLAVNEYLSRERIAALTRPIAWRSWLEILHTWGWIALAFAACAAFPHPLTYILAVFVIGGKQLACAIIMHDASHYALFGSRRLNIWVGNGFGAFWIMNAIGQYRPYHLRHHARTGRDDDPDIGLTKPYPCSRASLARKFFRDLAGITGVKAHLALLAMQLGFFRYTLSNVVERVPREELPFTQIAQNAVRNLSGPLAVHALLFSVLWLCGHPLLYALWWAAELTTFQFCLRVRSMAEHSMSPDRFDDRLNTRTVSASWLERMLFAPHYVNFHVEHHLLMTAPPYALPKIHRLLQERRFYETGLWASGYLEVIGRAGARN